jgi:hypothetical protein
VQQNKSGEPCEACLSMGGNQIGQRTLVPDADESTAMDQGGQLFCIDSQIFF